MKAKMMKAGLVVAAVTGGATLFGAAYDEMYSGGGLSSGYQVVEVDTSPPPDTRVSSQGESEASQYSLKRSDTTREGGTTIINNYYYYDDDYYDYYYTARIRRFYYPIIGASYWCGYYVDYYFYEYDPFVAGVSIYISYPFFRVWVGYPWWWNPFWWDWWVWHVYYYDPFWWTVCHYHYPWWRYHHAYWHGYWDGYWDGYWHGYADGYWDGNRACYYYNRRGTIPYHYNQPRGSEYITGSSVWRTSATVPISTANEHPGWQSYTPRPFSDIGVARPTLATSVQNIPAREITKGEGISRPALAEPRPALSGNMPQTSGAVTPQMEPPRHVIDKGGINQAGNNPPPAHIRIPGGRSEMTRPQAPGVTPQRPSPPYGNIQQNTPDRNIQQYPQQAPNRPKPQVTPPQPAQPHQTVPAPSRPRVIDRGHYRQKGSQYQVPRSYFRGPSPHKADPPAGGARPERNISSPSRPPAGGYAPRRWETPSRKWDFNIRPSISPQRFSRPSRGSVSPKNRR